MRLQVLVPLPVQAVGAAREPLSGLLAAVALIISLKSVLLLLLGAGPLRVLLIFDPVPDRQVGADDRLEKRDGAGPVRQDVEHLQVDAAPVIVDAVEKSAASRVIQGAAGGLLHRLYDRADAAAVQVVPEQPFPQDAREVGEVRGRPVQRLLQDRLVDLLVQLAADAEDAGVRASCRGGHDLRCVIQFIPFRLCHLSSKGVIK